MKSHGMSRTKTYNVWCNMKRRCQDTGNKHYGGKGVVIDPSWESFENFLADMGIAPEGMSIDRIDNNKGYCKENCKWSNQSEQTHNQGQKRTNSSGRTGVTLRAGKNKWEAYISVSGKRIYGGLFEKYEDAVARRQELEIEYMGKPRPDEYEVSRKECE